MVDLNKIFIKHFQKSQGRNFVNFLTKEIDARLENAFLQTFREFFDDFMPSFESFPVCIIANAKFAQNLISIGSELEVLIVHKNVTGYNIKPFLKSLNIAFENLNLNLSIKNGEVNELFDRYKDDIKAKSSLCVVRFICGSKGLYKRARDEINSLKEYKKDEFLKYHLKALSPFDSVTTLDQEPNIKTGFGGIDEVWRLNCIISTINSENQARLSSLYFDEKQLSQFNLNVDFLLSLRSALNLTQNSDKFIAKSVDRVTSLLQTKSKKSLDNEGVISQKMLNSMRNLGFCVRFGAVTLARNLNISLSQKRALRLKNGLYQISNTIYAPLHKTAKSLKVFLKELNDLRDIELKFDISAIFYIKRVKFSKDETDECNDEIKRIFMRKNSFGILKALLDADVLGDLIKPLEHTIGLTQYDSYHKFSVDEHSVFSVKQLENIKDNFIKSLYNELCMDGKLMLKLVALLHDVGKASIGEHAVVGANIFRAYVNRLGLKSEAVNIGVTLVKYHTLMSNVANREDIYSERVIFSFISKLADKQTLKLLYILTYCVINATDESLYNSYTAKLLRELYEISLLSFDDETLLDEATRRIKKESSIRRNDEFLALPKELGEKIFQIPSNLLFIKYQTNEIIALSRWANEVKQIQIDIKNEQNLSLSIISNQKVNLSLLLYELASFDLAYMEIYELFENKNFIKLEFNKTAKNSELINLQNNIKTMLLSDKKPNVARPIISKDELHYEPNHSKEYARLNINAKDQRGLMAYVMSILQTFSISVANARIQTIKNRTRNLFLISKADDLCYNWQKILNQLISE
ncbi:HD domain-containing protein [Campylobacter mucosalis]|uniref:HD domain-containing protein n=1 Tax=Campylobacter mucosalis TaxID=202 RepID=UPI0014706C57|nr:HD domain-containing protein [Campylobacter mucosalis]